MISTGGAKVRARGYTCRVMKTQGKERSNTTSANLRIKFLGFEHTSPQLLLCTCYLGRMAPRPHLLPLSPECRNYRFEPACQVMLFIFIKILFFISNIFFSLLFSSPLHPSLSHALLFLPLLTSLPHLISLK